MARMGNTPEQVIAKLSEVGGFRARNHLGDKRQSDSLHRRTRMRSIRSASPQSYTASAFDWVSLSTDARDARYRRSKVKVEVSTLTRRSPPHPSFGRAAMTMLRWLGSRLRTPAAAGIARVALGSGGPTRHPATFPPNILSPGSAFPVKAAPLALRCGWVGVGLGATVSGKLSRDLNRHTVAAPSPDQGDRAATSTATGITPSPTDQGAARRERASAAACPRPAASRDQRGCPLRSGQGRSVALRRTWARFSDRLTAKIGKSALEPLRRVDTVAGRVVSLLSSLSTGG